MSRLYVVYNMSLGCIVSAPGGFYMQQGVNHIQLGACDRSAVCEVEQDVVAALDESGMHVHVVVQCMYIVQHLASNDPHSVDQTTWTTAYHTRATHTAHRTQDMVHSTRATHTTHRTPHTAHGTTPVVSAQAIVAAHALDCMQVVV